MKIRYLGTAAAEGTPAPFCECDVCEYARANGGKNIRTRTQALIDDSVLIDLCPDTFWHSVRDGLKLCYLDACLVTHSHSDHLSPKELFWCVPSVAQMKTRKPFAIYGSEEVVSYIRAEKYDVDVEGLEKDGGITLGALPLFTPSDVCGYRVTPLAADHPTKSPVLYIIEKDGKSILYATDTGYLPEKTWEYLASIDTVFDVVSYDATYLIREADNRYHMNLDGNTRMRERLIAMGRANEKTRHVLQHFSHKGLLAHDALVPVAEERGFIAAFDGMEIVL